MHYKNGREAKENDPVILKFDYPTPRILAGVIHGLDAGATSCNATVAVITPGAVCQLPCINVQDCYHAEDAFAALEAIANAPNVIRDTGGAEAAIVERAAAPAATDNAS